MKKHGKIGFTLVELLVVIVVIAILAAITLVGLQGVNETARVAKTKGLVVRLNEIVMEQWDAYRTRPVPFDPSSLRNAERSEGRAVALARLLALRELMRMEMPDRVSDVRDGPNVVSFVIPPRPPQRTSPITVSFSIEQPALWKSYRAYARSSTIPPPLDPANNPTENWTPEFQGAECLFLITLHSPNRWGGGLDKFKPGEIGDVDGDGMKEFIDAWGNPIEFIRWAPGFLSDYPNAAVSTFQVSDAAQAPDQFDVMRVDPRWPSGFGGTNSDPLDDPFALWPLIFSAGQDENYDIVRDFSPRLDYSNRSFSPVSLFSDPYCEDPNGLRLGTPRNCDDATGQPALIGKLRYADNIVNQSLDSRL